MTQFTKSDGKLEFKGAPLVEEDGVHIASAAQKVRLNGRLETHFLWHCIALYIAVVVVVVAASVLAELLSRLALHFEPSWSRQIAYCTEGILMFNDSRASVEVE